MVQQGKLRHDPNQERVAKELDRLLENLHRYEREMEEYHVSFAYFSVVVVHPMSTFSTIFELAFAGKPCCLGEE